MRDGITWKSNARKQSEETDMSMLLDRLVIWIAEILDRNLLTVPDLDDAGRVQK